MPSLSECRCELWMQKWSWSLLHPLLIVANALANSAYSTCQSKFHSFVCWLALLPSNLRLPKWHDSTASDVGNCFKLVILKVVSMPCMINTCELPDDAVHRPNSLIPIPYKHSAPTLHSGSYTRRFRAPLSSCPHLADSWCQFYQLFDSCKTSSAPAYRCMQ